MAFRFGLSALVTRRLLQHEGCAQVACRGYAAENNKLATKTTAVDLSDTISKDWKRVKDKQTGQHYWWNKTTDETSAVGAPNPGAWKSATDESTGLQYWWHPDTGETTAVGEPKPGVQGREVVPAAHLGGSAAPRSSIAQLVTVPLALGLGMGLAFGLARVLFS